MVLIEDVNVVRQEQWTATSHLQPGSKWAWGVGYVCPPAADSMKSSLLTDFTTEYRVRYGEVQSKIDGIYHKTLPYTVVEGRNALVFLNSVQTYTDLGEHPPLSCGESVMTWREPILVSGAPDPYRVNARALSLQNKCRDRLVDKIAATGPNLPVTMLEARDTYDMVVDTARRLKLTLRACARGDLLGAIRHLGYTRPPPKLNRLFKHRRRDGKQLTVDDALNNWLLLRYGWLPTLSDIFSILQQIEKDFIKGRETLLYAKTTQVVDVGGLVDGATSNGTIGQYLFSCGHQNEGTDDTRITCHAWARYRETSTLLRMLHEWGILNPGTVAWEILPLSFVGDWIISVGGWLKSLDYAVGLELDDAGIGTTITNLRSGVLRDNWNRKEFPYFATYMSYERKRFDSFSAIPPPFLRRNENADWRHIVDAVALFRAFTK